MDDIVPHLSRVDVWSAQVLCQLLDNYVLEDVIFMEIMTILSTIEELAGGALLIVHFAVGGWDDEIPIHD